MIKKYLYFIPLLLLVHLSFAQVLVINSFSPASGSVGSAVIISGSGFNTTPTGNHVLFGAAKAVVTASTATAITVTVPAGATFQPISVQTDSFIGFSSRPFITTFPQGGGDPLPPDAFGKPVSIAPLSKPAFADFDGDGKVDMAGAVSGNKVAIYTNSSDADSLSYKLRLTLPAFGNAPEGILAADFTGDGKPELVVFTFNLYAIFKNTSTADTISFAPYTYLGAGGIYSQAATDMDGDGKIDLVSGFGSSSNAFSVLRNIGTGGNIAFALPVRISFGSVPGGSGTVGSDNIIMVADVDGDRKPDVVTKSRFYPPFLIYRNTSTPGSISFANNVPLISGGTGITGNGNFDMKVGDIDGDNKPEIAFIAPDSAFVAVYRNTSTVGNISYSSKMRFETGYAPYGLGFNDMDGDSKTDLVIAQYFDSITILKNNSTAGSLSFETRRSYQGGYQLTSHPADVDGDGKADILMARNDFSNAEHNTVVLKSYVFSPVITSVIPITASSGTPITIKGNRFTNATLVSFGGSQAASFEIISDTMIIAVVANGASGNVTVSTAYGDGKFSGFTFSLPIPSIDSFAPVSGRVGYTVIIRGKNFSSITTDNLVHFGSGKAVVIGATDTTLTVLAPSGTSYLPISVTVMSTHLTAFSRLPFTTTFDSRIAAFTNANFGDTVNYATPSKGTRIVTADFDNDAKPDIAASIYYDYSGVSVYKNKTDTGKPAFDTAKNYSTYGAAPGGNASGVTSTVTVDLDGDGKPDMATISNGADVLSVFRNNGITDSIAFELPINFSAGQNPTNVSTADLDNDGKPDIAITNPYPSGRITILKNTSKPGTISFAPKLEFIAGSVPQRVLLEDFDNDGKKDMACTNINANNISVFRNISTPGTIAFTTPTTKPTGTTPISMAAADLNGDGFIDILVTNNSSKSISVFKNTSNTAAIVFANRVDYSLPDFPGGLTVADLDGDAKPDVVSGTNTSPSTLSLFKNLSTVDSIILGPRSPIAKTFAPNSIYTTDVNGDGKPEIIVAGLNTNRIAIVRNIIGDPIPTSVCPSADSTVLQAGLTGSMYHWQLNTGNGFADITNGTYYSGTDSATLVLRNVPSSWYGYQFRCVVDGRNSDTYSLKITARWSGAINGAWENPVNWNCGQLPDRNTDVQINAGRAIVNSNVEVRSLRLSPSAGVTVMGGFDVMVVQ